MPDRSPRHDRIYDLVHDETMHPLIEQMARNQEHESSTDLWHLYNTTDEPVSQKELYLGVKRLEMVGGGNVFQDPRTDHVRFQLHASAEAALAYGSKSEYLQDMNPFS